MSIQDMVKSGTAESHANLDVLAECIEACTECAQSCTACADACLSEVNVRELTQCIRLNQDCADVTDTTGRILSRATETPSEVTRNMLEACVAICQTCVDECEKHGDHYVHCRLCAESCRKCVDACNKVVSSISVHDR